VRLAGYPFDAFPEFSYSLSTSFGEQRTRQEAPALFISFVSVLLGQGMLIEGT
jgi:hypothetical protein